MKTSTLVIISVIVFLVLVASYWHATEPYTNINVGADSRLNLYKPRPTPQIANKGYSTCDGIVMV
jgi:hypothetical protein